MTRRSFTSQEVPNYGYQEAVRYLHIPNATLHYWLKAELNLVKPAGNRALSFKNMVELYVIKGLEVIHDVSMKQIQRAVEYLRKNFESRHPLADFELKTDGRWVFFYDRGEHVNISLMGQVGLGPILDTYLRRVERDWQKGTAALYPFTRLEQMRTVEDHPRVVVMNPNVCSGKPVLIGTRITTAILASRRIGGDTLETLARSYGRPVGEIEEAVAWETGESRTAA